MRASTPRPTSGAQDRLTRARLALKAAEERTGLRDSAALEVQRAVCSASAGSRRDSPLLVLAVSQASGVLSLQGSTTLLLAALALRQGGTGWCGVIGGDDLGWCAATEVGLDLNRVLAVPASALDEASTLTITSTLLDGVDALLVGASIAARLRPQHRRLLLARARERGSLILTPVTWEGARTLRAGTPTPDTGTDAASSTSSTQPPVEEPSTDGVVVPIRRRTSRASVQATEMPAGYLRRLTWTLTDPRRPRLTADEDLTLSLSAEGLQTRSPDVLHPPPGPQEAAG